MPKAGGLPSDTDAFLAALDDSYTQDAYHSLSIEGYRVSPEFVDRVRTGTWNPDSDPGDRSTRDAMAALGYRRTFQQVRTTVEEVVKGADAAALVRDRHKEWYRALLGSSVELASVRQTIEPCSEFIAERVASPAPGASRIWG